MPSGAKALCDTGPLVAMSDYADTSHRRCREAFAQFAGNLVTTWPVLTEAFHFLDRPPKREILWEFLARSVVEISEVSLTELSRMHELMTQYSNLPMDFADASLVVVGERLQLGSVFTLDRRDFLLYRPRHTGAFEVFP